MASEKTLALKNRVPKPPSQGTSKKPIVPKQNKLMPPGRAQARQAGARSSYDPYQFSRTEWIQNPRDLPNTKTGTRAGKKKS